MALTYSDNKRDEIFDIIDSYTTAWLDQYTRDEIKSVVEKAMKASGSSSISVADTIFDKLSEYEGNVVEATASEQVVPKDVIYTIRQEVLMALS